jgi:GAF domain-containing protein
MDAPDPAVAALVARLGDALGTATRPSELRQELYGAVSRVRQLYGAAACSFAQVEPDGATLRFVAADGAGADTIVGVTLPVSRGIVGWVAVSGEPMQVADVTRDHRFARDVAESTDYVPDTILAAPVVDEHGEIAGVIEVLDPTQRSENSGRDLAVLGLVADELASVIRLSSRYDALGTGLLRILADPQRTGAFDEAVTALVEDEDTGTGLTEVAEAFRHLAASGPAAARLAGRVLQEVAAFVGERR